MHVKVLRRKWHPEHMLNSVAWLCRYVLGGAFGCCDGGLMVV